MKQFMQWWGRGAIAAMACAAGQRGILGGGREVERRPSPGEQLLELGAPLAKRLGPQIALAHA